MSNQSGPGTPPSGYPVQPPQHASYGARPALPQGRGLGQSPVDLRFYLMVLWRFWWIVLLALGAGVAYGMWKVDTAIPRYRASCRIEVIRDQRLAAFDAGMTGNSASMRLELSRQSLLMESGVLRARVRSLAEEEWQEKLRDVGLWANVKVSPVRRAETMLDVSVDARQPDYALRYLRLLLQEYQTQRREDMVSASQAAMTSLNRELSSVRDALKTAQDELLAFQQQHNTKLTEAKAKWDERFLTSLIQRQNALKMEEAMLKTQLSVLETATAGTIQDALSLTRETHQAALGAMILSSPSAGDEVTAGLAASLSEDRGEWQSLESQMATLEADFQSKRTYMKATHPKMIKLQQQIQERQRRLDMTAKLALKRMTDRLAAIELQSSSLNDAIQEWREEMSLSVEDRSGYEALLAKVEHLRNLHNQVYQRVLDGSTLDVDSIYSRVVEAPWKAGQVWPTYSKIMSRPIIFSLALGFGIVGLIGLLCTGGLNVEDVEVHLGVPFLGGIPLWTRVIRKFDAKKRSVIVTRDTGNLPTEVYRSLCSTLERSMDGARGYVLAITSSDSTDGKSLTALNLAVSFSWTRRVLLIDCDLRRGQLRGALGLEQGLGLADYLGDKEMDWRKVQRDSGHANLTFISRGAFRQESPEELKSARMATFLAEAREAYDLVIIDTPPVGRVSDATTVARIADGTMLIARFDGTTEDDLQHAVGSLEGSHVIGFCLNGIDPKKLAHHRQRNRSYGYYGRYGYSYAARKEYQHKPEEA